MFDLWAPFLVVGSLWFWTAFVVFCIMMIIAVENESGKLAGFFTLMWAIFFFTATPLDPFTWAAANPWGIVAYITGYFVLGTVWSFAKWLFKCIRLRREVREFLDKNPNIDRNDAEEVRMVVRENISFEAYPPQVSQHKSDLLFWATYWPWSAFWTLLNDPIKYAWEAIYNTFGAGLQKITDRMFKDL